MKLFYLVILTTLTLTACTTDSSLEGTNVETLQKLSNLQLFEGNAPRASTQLGQVNGVSCERPGYFASNMSFDDAQSKLKLNAANLHADAVTNVICQQSNQVNWKHNCNASITCAGIAIKYK